MTAVKHRKGSVIRRGGEGEARRLPKLRATMLQPDAVHTTTRGERPAEGTPAAVAGGDAWVNERATAGKGPAWLRTPAVAALRPAATKR